MALAAAAAPLPRPGRVSLPADCRARRPQGGEQPGRGPVQPPPRSAPVTRSSPTTGGTSSAWPSSPGTDMQAVFDNVFKGDYNI